MSKRFRVIFANLSSLVITAGMIAVIAFFSIIALNNVVLMPSSEGETQEDIPLSQSERIDSQQVEDRLNEVAEKKRLEEEKIAREKAEQERIAREKIEQERLAREKAEQERIAKEKAKKEKEALIIKEKIEKERLEKEKKIEQERIAKEKIERENLEKEKAKKAEEERLAKEKESQAEKERVAREKAAQIEKDRLAKEASDRDAAERKARIDSSLNADYSNRVHSYLYSRWIIPVDATDDLSVTVRIRVNQNGTVIGTPELTKKSGNEAFDRSVIHAIRAASPIPMPDDSLAREFLARPDQGFEIRFRPGHL